MNREDFFQRALLLFAEKVFATAETVPDPAHLASIAGKYAQALHDEMLQGLTKLDIDEEVRRYEPPARTGTDGVPTFQPLRLQTKQTPPAEQVDKACPRCGSPMVQKHGSRGPFVGCSAFPRCRYIAKE